MKNLCGMLRAGETANNVNKVLDVWLDDYKADHVLGYLEIVNFFIHASGCKGRVTQTGRKEEQTPADMLKQMTSRFDEVIL